MSISSEELRTLHEKKGKIKVEGNQEKDGTGANKEHHYSFGRK